MTVDIKPDDELDPTAQDGEGEPDPVRTDIVEDDPDAVDPTPGDDEDDEPEDDGNA